MTKHARTLMKSSKSTAIKVWSINQCLRKSLYRKQVRQASKLRIKTVKLLKFKLLELQNSRKTMQWSRNWETIWFASYRVRRKSCLTKLSQKVSIVALSNFWSAHKVKQRTCKCEAIAAVSIVESPGTAPSGRSWSSAANWKSILERLRTRKQQVSSMTSTQSYSKVSR